MYRNAELRRHQYFDVRFPAVLPLPHFAAAARRAQRGVLGVVGNDGEDGYLKATKTIMDAASLMKAGVKSIPELHLFGESVGVFAFGSDEINSYELLDAMSGKGWALTGLQFPSGIHVSPTLRHAQPGVAKRFVNDIKDAVAYVKANPNPEGGMAPIYGLAATVPDRRWCMIC